MGVVISVIGLAAACGGGSTTIDAAVSDAASADAPGPFMARVDFATAVGPDSVAIADLNDDGKPDLTVASVGSDVVSIFLNTTTAGAITPSFAARVDLPTGSEPSAVAIRDLDRDGRPDLAVANFGAGVSVFVNTTTTGAATPSFAARVDLATGVSHTSIAIADINSDGTPDLALADVDRNVSVLLNTTPQGATTPTFSPAVELATVGSSSVAFGDFNADGKPDLMVPGGGQAPSVSVLLDATAIGATSPSFSAAVAFPTATTSTIPPDVDSGAVADLDADGKPDVVVTNNNVGGPEFHSVSFLLDTTTTGGTTPSFSANVDIATTCAPKSIAIADLDGDGKPDLVFASAGGVPALGGNSCGVSIMLNTTMGPGMPSFSPRLDFTTTSALDARPSVAIGDLNGDGKPDLVVGGDNAISVLLAQ